MNAGTQRWRSALAVALLAVAGIALVACGNDDDADAGEVNEITIVVSDSLAFEPAEIRIRANERYRLVLDNGESTMLHDFSVMHMPVHDVHEEGATHGAHGMHGGPHGAALHMAAEAGHMAMVEFTPTEPGEYRFVCTVPGHEQGGMVGTIIVE